MKNIFVILSCVLILAACGGSGGAGSSTSVTVNKGTLKIVNNTGQSIDHVYVAMASTTNWGADLLSSSITNGSTQDIVNTPVGSYDIKVVLADGSVRYEYGESVLASETTTCNIDPLIVSTTTTTTSPTTPTTTMPRITPTTPTTPTTTTLIATTTTTTMPHANTAPVAIVGGALSVYTGNTVFLSGWGSYDPDGDPITFQWAFVSRPIGSTATLSSTTHPTPIFVTDIAGDYTLSLVVSDGTLSSSDTVTATAKNK